MRITLSAGRGMALWESGWNRTWLLGVLREAQNLLLLVGGTVVAALAYVLFQIPYNLAAGGVTGLGIIVTHFSDLSEGVFYFVMNVPLMAFGFFYLGRWQFLGRTFISVIVFSATTDLLMAYLPRYLDRFPITDNVLLAAIYAGVVGGIGGGLIYRAGATMGGTSILGRIIQMKTGFPLSQSYLYTDGLIIFAAGLIFEWEIALYAFLTLLLSGFASDYVLEGPSRARTATIVTKKVDEMSRALTQELDRGVTRWPVTGGYSGSELSLILCTIYRSQVTDLKRIVSQVDPDAFVSIDVTQQVLGSGFARLIR